MGGRKMSGSRPSSFLNHVHLRITKRTIYIVTAKQKVVIMYVNRVGGVGKISACILNMVELVDIGMTICQAF
jgi:hypothetical protein